MFKNVKLKFLLTIFVVFSSISLYTQTIFPDSIPENIKLDDNFEFYYKQLFTTGANKPTQTAYKLQLTDSWDRVVKTEGNPNIGFGTYYKKLAVPKSLRNNLRFFIPAIKSSYKLYIDNKLVAAEGIVGTSYETAKPNYKTNITDQLITGDSVEFVLQMSNFVHSSAGVSIFMFMGDGAKILHKHNYLLMRNGILGGCLIMGSIFFLCLYLFKKRDNTLLLFAVFMTLIAYRVFNGGYYSIPVIFPNLSFTLASKFDYLTLPIPAIIYAIYVRMLLPNEMNKYVIAAFIVVQIFFAVVVIVTPLQVYSKYLLYIIVTLLIATLYVMFGYCKAFIRKESGAGLGAASFLFFGLLIVFSILEQFNILHYNDTIEFISYVGFFAFQSAVLIKRFSDLLKKATKDIEQNLQIKTSFLRTMSHEIRTPLNGLIGVSQLLQQDKHTLNNQQIEYLDTLQFSSNNLLNIVNDILDYEKLDANKFEFEKQPLQLQLVGQHIINTFKKLAQEKGINFELKFDASIPTWVIGDSTRLVQVLNNLVSNAIKFTNQGSITLDLKAQKVTVNSLDVLFKISDSGIGIEQTKIESILEPFSQADSSINRKYGGTGLGLSICSKILKNLKSQLFVSSIVDKGSVFSFTINFIIPQNLEFNNIEQYNTPILVNKKVLLVEDNKINILVAKRFLEKWEMNVIIAENGKEAVDKCLSENFDVILMDLQMPIMDGYEASYKILNHKPSSKIIALTANLDGNVQNALKQIGVKYAIAKPYKQNELYDKICEILKK